MPTPDWNAFAVGAVVVTCALLFLSWASARTFSAVAPGGDGPDDEGEAPAPTVPTGGALVANVGLTHGLLGLALLGLVWYAAVPLETLGASPVAGGQVTTGIGIGAGLYLASEAATAVADRVGFEYDERLRESLAPDAPAEWAALLFVALPLVAGAEELLFRGILIGALGAGFGLPVWWLAVGSSVLFGVGHGAQGPVGVAVTASLGLVLAAAFVLTGSLVVVVVAHYTVDALEFVVREGLLD